MIKQILKFIWYLVPWIVASVIEVTCGISPYSWQAWVLALCLGVTYLNGVMHGAE